MSITLLPPNYIDNTNGNYQVTGPINIQNFVSLIGDKRYELSNHLGNVLVVVTDKKVPLLETPTNPFSDLIAFNADVLSYNDYYPFGMLVPNRHGSSNSYRYGFNGMEKDDELKGIGNSYNTEFRQYDPRVGRWLSLDPLEHKFPWMSPYVSFNNNPLSYIDSDGLEASDPPSQANVVQSNAIATKAIDKVGNNAAKRSWGARFVSSLLGLEGAEKQHQRGVQLENFIKSEVGKVYDEGSKEYAELFNNTLSQYEESSYLSRVNPKLYNGYNSLLNEHATIEDKFYILANRSQHIKEAYSDKFAMTGLILSAYAAAFPGGGVSSASATSRTFSYLPRYSNVKGASELATVGRWMSQTEFKAMSKTGYVVESKTGTTHVTYPANPKAFTPNDKNSIFVTFKVPKSALKTTNAEGVKQWAKIIGPNSLEARLAALKKAQVPQMPKATDIKVLK